MSGYSLLDYGKMISDPVRVGAYRRALERVITPGATVLEAGAGPGLFSLLACQLGAAKVWAVETAPVISLARQLVESNGFGDRVELIQASAESVELDQRVDVLVSDLRGVLPLVGRHLPVLRSVRDRLLLPEGRMVAERDRLRVAVVESEDLYRLFDSPWREGLVGLDLSPGRELSIHGWLKPTTGLDVAARLTEPATWFELDYRTFDSDHGRGSADLEVRRRGTAHGLALWFESEVVSGVELSNAPWEERRIYGWVFVALEHPVGVEPGDRIEVDLDATLVDDAYVWSWATRVGRGATELARFRQSSFYAEPLSPRS